MNEPTGRLPTTRPSGAHLTEVVLILWLVVLWGALWQDYGIGNLVFGLVLAVLVVRVFKLPPVRSSGRFNALRALEFLAKFLWWVFLGSVQVLWLAVRPGPQPSNAVVSVRLRSTDDLIMTAVGQVISLIPGSLVVEVDRRSATIYFHAIDVATDEDVRRFRDRVFAVERLVVEVMGSREHLAEVRGRTGGRTRVRRFENTGPERAVQRPEAAASSPGPGAGSEEERQ